VTHVDRQTPTVALLAGGALGYGAALVAHFLGSTHPVGAVLLNVAVFGAVISYVLQMLSFILLRLRLPHIERPYRSPLGMPGAVIALVIAAVTLGALFFSDPVFQQVAVGAAVWYAAGLVYFAAYGRKHLVYAPEEEFAMRM
jgi:ethanolamine permease